MVSTVSTNCETVSSIPVEENETVLESLGFEQKHKTSITGSTNEGRGRRSWSM